MALLFLMATGVDAQNIFWTGGGDGTSWEDPNNWDLQVVPTDQDYVEIGGGTAFISSEVSVKNLVVKGSASLTITHSGELSFPTNSNIDMIAVLDNANMVNVGVLSITG
ncbi:MAG: hypothetical protein HRU12_10875, partial [Phaeodactylibacter sp.]|nr:hypothetical protein [Phaeodactylibacter sp.]